MSEKVESQRMLPCMLIPKDGVVINFKDKVVYIYRTFLIT